MRHYCLGFAFDPDQNHVLLLNKRSSSDYNPGTWNGVGGHVEKGETALEAMVRECAEEAGLTIDAQYWHSLGALTDGENYRVDIFAATALLDAARQTTDEVIQVFDRQAAASLDYADDVDDILSVWLNGGQLL